MEMIPSSEQQQIIDVFVDIAREEGVGAGQDFSKMTDRQIGEWLLNKANLLRMWNHDSIEREMVRYYWEREDELSAWDALMDAIAKNLNESKFSSFKNQQTITENFRRFLKK